MVESRKSRLTDALIQQLTPAASGAPYRVADADQAGLFVVVESLWLCAITALRESGVHTRRFADCRINTTDPLTAPPTLARLRKSRRSVSVP